MNITPVLPIGSMERAISLPEVLACIFSWLKDERYTLRCVRLVSKGFLAVANQFFRVHLTSDYALEHNCIQEAAGIIGGLTLTFPRIIIEEAGMIIRHLGSEQQDNIVSLGFCSMVAQNCVHLEKIKIVLEGQHSEEISQLLSCLFSQNPESAAVFRIKSLEFVFGSKFMESIIQDIRNSNLPESSTGHLPNTNYIPIEAPFSRLENLKLINQYLVDLPIMYRILQLKVCPEVAAATSFLGPVCWNRIERDARLPTASSMARPSKTLKIFQIPHTPCSLDMLFSLKEQAPELEDVDALTLCNTNESITNEEAFARDSARSPGTLRLKKLNLITTTDRDAKLLLCRLIDPSIFKSYMTNFICRMEWPAVDNNADWFATQPAPSNILNEILDEMSADPVSGKPQGRFFREFGFNSCDLAVERVNWLQRLKDIPRLHRLENLSLPLTIDQFLDIFDAPIPLTNDPESSVDPATAATTAAKRIAASGAISTEDEPLLETQQQPLPFPACSSLLSFRIGGCNSRILREGYGRRFASYLIRSFPRLNHLHIPKSSFTDFTFFDAIAPSTLPPPASSSSSSSLFSSTAVSRELNLDDGTKRMTVGDGDRFSKCNNNHRHHSSLYRLESLTLSFNFMSQSEFRNLPKSERAVELIEKREDSFERFRRSGPEDEGYEDYRLIERELYMEGQRMLLEARTIQCHEDRMEQFLAILTRFQRERRRSAFIDGEHFKSDSADANTGAGGDVTRLRRMVVDQVGMPEMYVEKLKARVASQFPELDFKISGAVYHLERSEVQSEETVVAPPHGS